MPLFVLPERGHTAFQVSDSVGELLPKLNRTEERDTVARWLEHQMRALTTTAPSQTLHDGIVARLSTPPLSPRRRLSNALRGWLGIAKIETDEPPASLVRDLANHYGDKEAVAQLLTEIEHWRSVRLLLVRVDRTKAVQVLTTRSLLAVPARRRSIWSPRSALSALRRFAFGSISWGTRVPLPGVAHCASFHVHVEAPQGFRVIGAAVITDVRDISGRELQLFDDDRLHSTAHIHVPRSLGAGENSVLAVNFYAHKSGLFSEALAVSLLTAALFFTMSLWLHKDFETRLTESGGSDFAASLVLLLPAAASTAITQHDDHRIASRAFALSRLFLFIQSVASLAGAMVFALNLDNELGRRVWDCASWVTYVVAARVVLSSANHIWRISVSRDRLLTAKRGIEGLRTEYRAARAPGGS